MFQLPAGVDGDVVGTIFYSFICLISNIVLVWLVWAHERTSYIAFISYFTLFATATSIVQQFYDYSNWIDLMETQFYFAKENIDNAEVQFYQGATGVKLILSYFRVFAFNIESTYVLFFALSLAMTVYGWVLEARLAQTLQILGRVIPVVATVITIGTLQTEGVQKSFLKFMLAANTQFIISSVGAIIFLFMILAKYMRSRKKVKSLQQQSKYTSKPSTMASTVRSSALLESRRRDTLPAQAQAAGSSSSSRRDTVTLASSRNTLPRSRRDTMAYHQKPNSTYDNWLVIRLALALAMLCVFGYLNILSAFSRRNKRLDDTDDGLPNLSAHRARSSIRGYLSGVTPSIVAFIVFGTTRTFRQRMWRTFVPRSLRHRLRRRRNNAGDVEKELNSLEPPRNGSSRPQSKLPSSSIVETWPLPSPPLMPNGRPTESNSTVSSPISSHPSNFSPAALSPTPPHHGAQSLNPPSPLSLHPSNFSPAPLAPAPAHHGSQLLNATPSVFSPSMSFPAPPRNSRAILSSAMPSPMRPDTSGTFLDLAHSITSASSASSASSPPESPQQPPPPPPPPSKSPVLSDTSSFWGTRPPTPPPKDDDYDVAPPRMTRHVRNFSWQADKPQYGHIRSQSARAQSHVPVVVLQPAPRGRSHSTTSSQSTLLTSRFNSSHRYA